MYEIIVTSEYSEKRQSVLKSSALINQVFIMRVQRSITVDEVMNELNKRSQKTGNLKQFHQVDKNS